jgi:hypothetical protein
MATVRISQLTAITTPTDDDIFIINDADTNTRKISFGNLTQNLLNTTGIGQTKNGPLTISGTLTAGSNFVVDTNTFYVDATNKRVGVRTTTPAVELDIAGTARIRSANSLQLGDAGNANHVALKAPAVVTSTFTLTLPESLPAVTNLLAVNTAGTVGYSTGISYNAVDSALELGDIRLTDRGYARFYEETANGSDYIQLRAPALLATTNSYTLPAALPGTSGFVLSSDTSGVLNWVSNAAGAAGTGGEIQFNDGLGVLGASSNLAWNNGTNTLSVTNVTVTGVLTAQGDVDLGDAITDSVSFVGRVDTDIVPIADGAHDLGTSLLRYAEAHVNDLYVYNDVASNLIPASGAETIGNFTDRWSQVHGDVFNTGGVTIRSASAQPAVASTAAFTATLGTAAAFGSFKVLIHAKDDVTGATEFYEQFVTHDGSGNVSEITGTNVQSTPGNFLTTPAASISGANVVLALTNSALSGNAVSMKVEITAFAA